MGDLMRAKKRQKTTWKDIGHDDLRELDVLHKLPDEQVVEGFDDLDLALAALELHLGFIGQDISVVSVQTPVGVVGIDRANLAHIVEKRRDARERYVKYALATMRDPLEVWLVEYEDDDGNEEWRHNYIGAFGGKHQMLVVCAETGEKTLWNFMHSDAKSLNRHRHGECIYRRPTKK